MLYSKYCFSSFRGFTEGLGLFTGTEFVIPLVRFFRHWTLTPHCKRCAVSGCVVVSAVEASSAAKLSALCSEGAVIPDAALFASLGCWNLHNFNNLVKKEATAFISKLHDKLHVHQMHIFIKSSELASRVMREECSRCLSWERVWCALGLDLIWCFKLF